MSKPSIEVCQSLFRHGKWYAVFRYPMIKFVTHEGYCTGHGGTHHSDACYFDTKEEAEQALVVAMLRDYQEEFST